MAGTFYHADPYRPFYGGDYHLTSMNDWFYPSRNDPNYMGPEKDDKKGGGGGGGSGGGGGKGKGKKVEGDADKIKDENPDGEKEVDGKKKGGSDKSKTQTIEIKADLCCDNCVRKVRKKLDDLEGVEKIDCCQWTKKVTVKGTAKPETVLRRVQKVKKDATIIAKNEQKK